MKQTNQAFIAEQLSQEKRYWMRITYACNNYCRFCLDSENRTSHPIPFEELQPIMDQALQDNYHRLIVSGGEASIHPDFLRIIHYAREKGFRKIQTISNGRMFSNATFTKRAKMVGLDEITFSIHGIDAATHDYLTNSEGSWKQAVQGLKNALALGFIVSVDITLNKLNIASLKEYLEWLMQLGVYEFDLLYMIPFGRAYPQHIEELAIDKNVFQYELHRALSVEYHPKPHIWTSRIPMEYLEGLESFVEGSYKLIDETNGRWEMMQLWIQENRPFPCREPSRCKHCVLHDYCDIFIPMLESWKKPIKPAVEVFPDPSDPSYHFMATTCFSEACHGIKRVHLRYDIHLSSEGILDRNHPITWDEILQDCRTWSQKSDHLCLQISADTAQTITKQSLQDVPMFFYEQLKNAGIKAYVTLILCYSSPAILFKLWEKNLYPSLHENTTFQWSAQVEIRQQWINDSTLDSTHPFWKETDLTYTIPRIETLQSCYTNLGMLDWDKAYHLIGEKEVYGSPKCYFPGGKRVKAVPGQALFTPEGNWDHIRFGHYYLCYHNYVKSLRCQSCMKNNDCPGLPVTLARMRGLRSLHPF